MTREEEIWYERRRELLQMIREAGISTGGHPMNPLQAYPEQFERFAALVYELVIKHEREKEREECAKVAEEHYNYYGCDFIAKAIRARGV